jgi:MFS superfamily sulfate permease-like transporter
MIKRFLPFLKWYEGYTYQKFRFDLIAGCTVALVLIPQSMAYAQLAGLPAYYGLYAAFLPPLIASLFGSSNQLATGPVAVVSLMTSASLEPLATAGSESFIAYAILLALMVGIFQFLLGVLRLGIVVNLLSHPVIIGFTNAAAIIIATSQLSKIFGVYVDKAEHHYETIYRVIDDAFHYTHLPTLGIAILAFAIMIILKRINPKIPYVLAAAILTILISKFSNFEKTYKADISLIQVQNVRETIHVYNETLSEIEAVARVDQVYIEAVDEVRNDIVKSLSAEEVGASCYNCHTAKEFSSLGINVEKDKFIEPQELLKLIHDAGFHERHLNILSQKPPTLREEIREFHLEAVDLENGQKIFYPYGNVPADKQGDENVWRIKVKNGRIDESSISLSAGGDVVGIIPAGLPELNAPQINLSIMSQLITAMIIISLLGFMEAISIAKAMAIKTGQRLDPNQELIGQGIANIIGSFGQSYPVSGSFSRSAVNLQAGGVTGLSNVLSSMIVAITLLFFTPLLYHLPQAVLAAVIMMAVIGLINIKPFMHAFHTQKYDGFIAVITFISTLYFAPHLDRGILIGVLLSLGHLVYRRIEPSIVLLSMYKKDNTFRNIDRWGLSECQYICLVRLQGSLTFANCNYLEDKILEQTSIKPDLKYVIIVGNAINEVDASGEGMLSTLIPRLLDARYKICFSGLNDSILDTFKRTGLYDKIGEENFFRNATIAVNSVFKKAHEDSAEEDCPLYNPTLK